MVGEWLAGWLKAAPSKTHTDGGKECSIDDALAEIHLLKAELLSQKRREPNLVKFLCSRVRVSRRRVNCPSVSKARSRRQIIKAIIKSLYFCIRWSVGC